jgi:hypothetical protein
MGVVREKHPVFEENLMPLAVLDILDTDYLTLGMFSIKLVFI